MAGGFITTVGKKVCIRLWEENNILQKWKIELAYERFGFWNQSSGKLLGVYSFLENLVAKERKLKHWVLFYLILVAGGFAFWIPNSWIWSEVFLV